MSKEASSPFKTIKYEAFLICPTPSLSRGVHCPSVIPGAPPQNPDATKNTIKITRFGLALFLSFTLKCLESTKITQIRIVPGSMSIKKLWGSYICIKVFCGFMILHLTMFEKHFCQKFSKKQPVSAKNRNLQIAHWFRHVRCLPLVDFTSYDYKASF